MLRREAGFGRGCKANRQPIAMRSRVNSTPLWQGMTTEHGMTLASVLGYRRLSYKKTVRHPEGCRTVKWGYSAPQSRSTTRATPEGAVVPKHRATNSSQLAAGPSLQRSPTNAWWLGLANRPHQRRVLIQTVPCLVSLSRLSASSSSCPQRRRPWAPAGCLFELDSLMGMIPLRQ